MSYDPSERETGALNTGRLLRTESSVLLPLLEQQREDAINLLCQAFRAGRLNDLPMHAAQIVTIDNMKAQIKIKIAKANNIERKIFENTDVPTDY